METKDLSTACSKFAIKLFVRPRSFVHDPVSQKVIVWFIFTYKYASVRASECSFEYALPVLFLILLQFFLPGNLLGYL